jgi:hypothetical protein
VDAPELFPLPAPESEHFARTDKGHFGWCALQKGQDIEFVVKKWRWTGSSQAVAHWPLSEDGWQEAWSYMCAEQPELATAVAHTAPRNAERDQALRKRAETQAALDNEGRIDLLPRCVLLGGYGFETGIASADSVDLYFTRESIWVAKTGGVHPYLRRPYSSLLALEFRGGTVRTGGGYVGGGFGTLGAAEGMAIANLLNSVTTKTKVHTTLRLEAEDAEVFFFTDQASPQTLEMRLAEVRGLIKAARRSEAPVRTSAGDDCSERLLRLGEMLDKGQLSPEEFAQAKARLFDT